MLQDYLLWLSTNHSKHALDLLENTSLSSDTAISVPLNIAVSSVLDLRIFDRSLQPSVKGVDLNIPNSKRFEYIK